tara:strand:+ start:814 stop:990 length:177 start_codon:yes stop_codon:yes gene_type:complete
MDIVGARSLCIMEDVPTSYSNGILMPMTGINIFKFYTFFIEKIIKKEYLYSFDCTLRQ